MNKNLLIAAGVFTAIVVVGLFLIKKPATPPQTQGMPVPQLTTQEKIVTNEVTITGTEYSFNPASIIVKKGESIKLTFVNAGSSPHNLLIGELNIKTKTVFPGKSDTIEFTAKETGIFSFYCAIGNHQSLGMEGKIEIQ